MKTATSTDLQEPIKTIIYIVAPALIFLVCQTLLNQLSDELLRSFLAHEEIAAVSSCISLPFVVFVYNDKVSPTHLRHRTNVTVAFSVAVALASLLLLFLLIVQSCETEFLLHFIGFGIAGPIIEEIIYRGLVFVRSQMVFRDWPAILFSALLFAAGHQSIGSIVLAFFAGVIFSFAMKQTKTLLFPVFLHITWNLIYLLFKYASVL